MTRRLIVWGCSGHGRVVHDAARAMDVFDRIAFYDDDPALATPTVLQLMSEGFAEFIIGIGSNSARASCYQSALQAGLKPVTCIHPTAWISPDASIETGTVVMARVVIQSQAHIGQNCIVNTGVIVEHDCIIGEHTHLSPSVTLGGAVTVGQYVHMGIGSIALPGSRIGDRTIIGAGSVVLKEIPPDVTAFGVPAKVRLK